MDEFLNNVLKAGLTQNTDRRAQASDNFMALLDRAFGKNYVEVDPIQAAATRQIMHREAPIGAVPPSQ